MRIALTADPFLPVPPRGYGGIERVVALLVEELRARGHEVTLFAHPESAAPAHRLLPYGAPEAGRRARARALVQLGGLLLREATAFDVVHSFGRLAALLPVLPLRGLAKVQSYQRDGVPWRSVRVAAALAGRSIAFTGCSSSVQGARPPSGRWRTVFNCVDPRRYTFQANVEPDAPLVFLGRLEPIKGAHHAIAIARRTGRRLVIAGNRVEAGSARGYFDAHVAPHLDGEAVTYVGEVDDGQKDALLGAGAALLMPIDWDEPFGIVMIEAMACGTPVIAFSRGSVPEVVRPGVNGYAVRDVPAAVEAVAGLAALDRAAVRRDCDDRFSVAAVTDAYERLYRDLLEAARCGASC